MIFALHSMWRRYAYFLAVALLLFALPNVWAATVTSVASPTANGSYTTAAAVSVRIDFSQSVTATGTPRLQLNSGASAFANYASGSPGTILTFTYTIAAGETSANDAIGCELCFVAA